MEKGPGLELVTDNPNYLRIFGVGVKVKSPISIKYGAFRNN